MEPWRHLLPAEIHHGHESRLHEESNDALDGQWSAKDVAHKPRVVGPVGAKLKLQDDACGHTHGEVDTEELLPELGRFAPEVGIGRRALSLLESLVCKVELGLDDTHDDGHAKGERYEEPMVYGCQAKLSP